MRASPGLLSFQLFAPSRCPKQLTRTTIPQVNAGVCPCNYVHRLQEFVFHRILKISPFVETDPAKADYFYLPVYNHWCVLRGHKLTQEALLL